MRSPVSVRRGLNVVGPITLYRAIGRRPSAVVVDEQRRPLGAPDDAAESRGAEVCGHRLWDVVFEEWVARPGDQLQDRQGSVVLVTRAGQCHPVQLSPPQPRSVSTAFTHANEALSADWRVIDRLMAEGLLVVGSIRRTKQAPFNPAQVKFDASQPLVIARVG